MKLILFSLIAVLLVASPAPMSAGIALAAEWTLMAGDAWSLTVRVDSAAVGSAGDATLITGLRRFDTRLILGTGGIALWDFPAGTILSAGEGLVIVRAGDQSAQHGLTVLPAPIETVEALTGANNLPAYGDARGMVMALAVDAWGNPVQDWISAAVSADYPGAETSSIPLRYTSGLFWTWLPSGGSPGRVRATLSVDNVVDTLEIRQLPGDPARIQLSSSIECLDNADGRDILTLTARVTDARGSSVVNGTTVSFTWGVGSSGTASVLNGQAVLEIPAQVTSYQASAANAVSNRVRIGEC